MTEMTKVFPPRSSRRPRFILFTHFSNTNKAKTTLVYPNYWPTKIEYFDSASLRLHGLWALNNLSQRYAISISTIYHCVRIIVLFYLNRELYYLQFYGRLVRIWVLRVNDPVRYSSTSSRHATVLL